MTIHLTGTLRGTDAIEAWIVDGRITKERPHATPLAESVSGYVYPGLLDVHTHPGLSRTPEPLAIEEIRRRLEILGSVGVTAVRDAGSQQDANDARVEGLPRVLHCGRHIAQYKRYSATSRLRRTGRFACGSTASARRQRWLDQDCGGLDRSRSRGPTPLW